MARATPAEKQEQLTGVHNYRKAHAAAADQEIESLKRAALEGQNVFAALLKASRHLTLGQMSRALYEVGGQYRRNL
jgi:methylmalonyl-CoA mutase